MRNRKLSALAAVLVLALVGCGQASKPVPTSAPAATPSPAPAPAQPPPAPAGPLPKVTIMLAVDILPFAPMHIATARGYFKAEGVDAQIVVANGGPEAIAALVSKSAEFAASGSSDLVRSAEKGVELRAVQSMVNQFTMQMVARNEVISKLGLSRQAPVKDRLKALKGLTIGTPGPGSVAEAFTKYYVAYGGLDPDKDTKLVALGGGPVLTTALKQGQIDAYMLSAPFPEQTEVEGIGKIVVASGDVPGLDNFPYELLFTRADYMEQNKDVVRAVARAISRGNNFILDHPKEANDILKQRFSKLDPKTLEVSMESIRVAVPRDGLMSKQGWDNVNQITQATSNSKFDLSTTEGRYWTNQFLIGLAGKSD